MKNIHITDILDQTKFIELTEEDTEKISSHIADCQDCRQAFRAARIASVLLERNNFTVNPPPFFQAKVLNAWRNKQKLQNPFESFHRWWRAASAMVFLMLTTIAVLIAVTVCAPTSNNAFESQAKTTNYNLYSTDSVILNQKPRDLTTEQVFQVLYETKSDFNTQR